MASTQTLSNQPKEILKRYFGYDQFRPLQQDIIEAILHGKDCLVLMPTGGGKSICFQVPALVLPGITLVVSPLIALMKDQVESLKANGVEAAFVNSSLSASQQNQIWADCYSGKIKLLYVAPEKICTPNGISEEVQRLPLSLLAVDESHCISSWGHDFRPEYRKLKQIRSLFPQIPVIALTATADKVTRKDILTQLDIPDAKVFISSFDRPNLNLTVRPGLDRKKQILQLLKTKPNQSGIIYCLSRKATEDLAETLQSAGYKADYYHAGSDSARRSRVQEAFIKDELQVICATIAFGMGIDKSNIRWIIHHNLPNNVESYYQEIGRAGRDGLKADTILFYSYGDVMTRLDMINNSEADEEQKELRRAKLDRMKQYAEAQICRRQILLSYFNEETHQDCGNCDVCRNPRSKFDATILAQKALSAIHRSKEKLSIGVLVDVLRGMRSQTVLKYGYEQMPTFGVGRDLKAEIWMGYIMQMLNSGVMDIAYDEGHAFKLNNRSRQILKKEEKVYLSQEQPIGERIVERQDFKSEKQKVKENADERLFEELRKLRKDIAAEDGVPPYVVFHDSSLNDMVMLKPTNTDQLWKVQGMGQIKWEKYGKRFLKTIQHFLTENPIPGVRLAKGVTYLETLELYEKGLDIEAMAETRKLSTATIATHLVRLKQEGESIDLERFISSKSKQKVESTLKKLNLKPESNMRIQPLMEELGESVPTWEIRLLVYVLGKSNVG